MQPRRAGAAAAAAAAAPQWERRPCRPAPRAGLYICRASACPALTGELDGVGRALGFWVAGTRRRRAAWLLSPRPPRHMTPPAKRAPSGARAGPADASRGGGGRRLDRPLSFRTAGVSPLCMLSLFLAILSRIWCHGDPFCNSDGPLSVTVHDVGCARARCPMQVWYRSQGGGAGDGVPSQASTS
ncbi:MAG: hypothetical protein J3K34DRAFT_414758 [Monoraphidium minutum]|nr:MAG: hypothetical protein J3K34DRAFT_414758 [Monoraphidium minutum]